jgi:hypothetical protein
MKKKKELNSNSEDMVRKLGENEDIMFLFSYTNGLKIATNPPVHRRPYQRETNPPVFRVGTAARAIFVQYESPIACKYEAFRDS